MESDDNATRSRGCGAADDRKMRQVKRRRQQQRAYANAGRAAILQYQSGDTRASNLRRGALWSLHVHTHTWNATFPLVVAFLKPLSCYLLSRTIESQCYLPILRCSRLCKYLAKPTRRGGDVLQVLLAVGRHCWYFRCLRYSEHYWSNWFPCPSLKGVLEIAWIFLFADSSMSFGDFKRGYFN